MSKQVLDIQQMQHLKELGVDTSKASMVLLYTDDEGEIIEWEDADEFPGKFVELYDAETGNYEHSYRKYCGVFTLQDILDLLPKVIFNDKYKGKLCIEYNEHNNEWIISYKELSVIVFYAHDENIIDAAYKMLCWCAENGYVDTKK